MRSNLKLVTAPATEPITTADALLYLRIDNADENALIDRLIKSARLKLEEYLSIKFVSQVWDVYFDNFGRNQYSEFWQGTREGAISELNENLRNIDLPIGPVISLDQFNTYADDDIAVAETVANYSVDKISLQGRVGLKTGGIWPVTILRPVNGVQFRVTCGFAVVPEDLKQSILEYVAYMYENRGDKEATEIPPHVLQLCDSYRRYKLG